MLESASRLRTPGTVLVLCLLLLASVGASEPAAEVSDATWRKLDGAVKELSRKGREVEVEALLECMHLLGREADGLEKVRTKAKKELGRRHRVADEVPRVARTLRAVADDLVEDLDALDEEDRRHRAAVVLRLDDANEVAHRALGHVETAGGWLSPEMPAILERRAEIVDVLRRARKLEFEVEHGESDLPVFSELYGEKGHRVSWRGQVSLHSVRFTPAKLERMLLTGLRAMALTRYMLTGRLDSEITKERLVLAALGSRADYERSIGTALASRGLASEQEDMARRTSAYVDRRGFTVTGRNAEGLVAEGIHYFLHPLGGQPCLDLGHMNWVCLSFIGVRFPGVAQIDVKERIERESRTVASKEKRIREEMLILSQAGIAGLRSYIRYLASRGEDPPFSAAMVDQLAKIQGDAIPKTTSVVEFLQERGDFGRIWDETLVGRTGPGGVEAAFERALGEPLSAFEAAWRRWLLPREPGLAARLEGGETDAEVPADARKALARLGEVRQEAFRRIGPDVTHSVGYDTELSAGCRAHALYLDRHPEQKSAWPDAHEEYPDKEGFSPAGSVAGLSSVIAPGANEPEEAIDSWLATFYHRLPLLDPGLVRIGWALERGVAVMDAGSMVGPPVAQVDVLWPPPDARDVSPRFQPELPNPVPGEDQAAWGTCVTLQTFHDEPNAAAIEMHLYEGSSPNAAREVDCHFSSPSRPSNPELAPRGAYALIPKQHLDRGTRYTVLVKGLTERPEITWSFTTGS